jgi:hypothetical protein
VSRRRRASAAFLAAALSLGVVASGARAEDAPAGIGGFNLIARASPLQITYDSPGLLPVSPIVQVSVPESYSTLVSGPTGYSLASLAFPGPLLADLGSVITQTSPSCQPPFPIPIYPLRSEAFFPQGPTDSDASPVPGGRMHAVADGPTSSALGALSDLTFPAIFSIGSITGTSSTSGKGDSAITKARSVVSGFHLLAGAISIESIVTDLTATSTGDAGTTEGVTTVSGATIAGQAVTINENGVSLAGTDIAGLGGVLAQLGQSLNDALVQSGITIKVVNHQENKKEGLAERLAGGLVININYDGRTAPLLSTLLAAVPADQLSPTNLTECAPSSPQGLFNLLKETHIETIALGGASVSSNGSAGFGATPSLDVDTTVPGLPDLSGTDLGGASGDLGGSPLDSAGASVSAGALNSTGTNASASGFADGRAIPVALILLLLALFPVLGAFSQRFADATLAAGPTEICPLTEGDEGHG